MLQLRPPANGRGRPIELGARALNLDRVYGCGKGPDQAGRGAAPSASDTGQISWKRFAHVTVRGGSAVARSQRGTRRIGDGSFQSE